MSQCHEHASLHTVLKLSILCPICAWRRTLRRCRGPNDQCCSSISCNSTLYYLLCYIYSHITAATTAAVITIKFVHSRLKESLKHIRRNYLCESCRNSCSWKVANGRTVLLTGSAGGKMLFAFDLSALSFTSTHAVSCLDFFYIFWTTTAFRMIRCCIASHSLCYPQQAPKITVILFLSLQSKQENSDR